MRSRNLQFHLLVCSVCTLNAYINCSRKGGTQRPKLSLTRRNTVINDQLLSGLKDCESGSKATKLLQEALNVSKGEGNNSVESSGNNFGALFNSLSIPPGASDRRISDSELAIQTKIRNGQDSIIDLIEMNGDRDTDRASLALFCITIAGFFSAVGAEQYLPGPDIFRFIVVWILSFSPLAFVGLGIAAPTNIQRILVDIEKNIFPRYRRRMIYHEAGHFLIGHLLGIPVKKYHANAVKNAVEFFPLSNVEAGRDRAKLLGFESLSDVDTPTNESSDRPYFSPEGRGARELSTQSVFRSSRKEKKDYFLKLPSINDPTKSWPYRGFDRETMDKLAIVSMAGVCAEIIMFGNAEGGYADIAQLRQLFYYVQPELMDREKENKVKFAIGYATVQLRRHMGALQTLADAMEQEKDIVECILAIEKCCDVGGSSSTDLGKFGFVEQILSRRVGSIDGTGGGARLPRIQLSGDDSLYAALATSFIFLVWALAGGITLH